MKYYAWKGFKLTCLGDVKSDLEESEALKIPFMLLFYSCFQRRRKNSYHFLFIPGLKFFVVFWKRIFQSERYQISTQIILNNFGNDFCTVGPG
jgi:hypothetical protein